ncbi:hypothetical protein [Kribbella speibonae]|uniref:Uncharacterized protein n=1 Tax=Kribbella speibonae TaxID=1572660 RepID=A0ABY2A804_9ACTN|nr:hypothetical protein [Kribbella speibonae]TCC24582.1 hypothetical protein E0H58_10125 [Kribbella speibonae]
MSDVVNDAAHVLVPLLAAGANAAVEEASKAAGKKFAEAVGSVIEPIRKALRRDPKEPEVAAALQSALADGTIRIADLEEIVQLSRHRAGSTTANISGDVKNLLTDPVFNKPVTFE